jgi:hypothetical protein
MSNFKPRFGGAHFICAVFLSLRRCDWRQIVVVPDRRLARILQEYNEHQGHQEAESDADGVRWVIVYHRPYTYSARMAKPSRVMEP